MKNPRFIVMLLVIIILGLSGFNANSKVIDKNSHSILVGIEYFNGWWPRTPNNDIHCFWESHNKDWRAEFPGRVPLLGEYNCQETMDKEILAASEYCVDFFSILWYPMDSVKNGKIRDYLNAGVENFMNSPNSNLMHFMIEIANHDPNAIITDADWDKCIDVCVKSMKHSSYLRIDGRAVVKIHGGDQFLRDNGFSVERSKQVLQRFRKRAKDEGAGELLINVGNYSEKPVDRNHKFSIIGEIDATMQYNSLPEVPQRETDYPYELMVERAKQVREIRKKDVLCWIPYFPAGWNPKPWNDKRASFSLPTREEWKFGLEELKTDILKYSNFGFPKKDGSTQKAFTIYAWNEFGEGGIVAPTRGDQYMKLEEIKNVFGN